MRYGTNTAKVQEVLDFACRGQILNIPPRVADRSLIVVNDFDRAMYWARNEDIEEGGDEDIPTWSDVRSKEMATIYEKRYALHGLDWDVGAELSELLTPLYECLCAKLPDQYDRILDDIVGELHGCAYARALDPAGNPFFERLLNIYRAGGWPCGWDGRYPDGKLVVYVPT